MAATKQSEKWLRPAEIRAGVIGMGLMGHSIVACLLSAGHEVIAVTRDLPRHRATRARVLQLLNQMKREGLLKGKPEILVDRLSLSNDCGDLAGCDIVIESITEDLETKRQVYRAVEQAVSRRTIIGSNTSSIPLTLLQQGAQHPERFVGIHWDEPAHITRFMEVIAGDQTSRRYADRVMALAVVWGKEPSLLRRDVRGFITNRISYAMFREACHLVDSGVATIEDVDRSLRNDVGWWITFAGPFRYMDLMGVQGYYRVMKDLLPDLSAETAVPRAIRKVVESGGRGISNQKGFYKYTPQQAKRWEQLFTKFNYEIRRLAMKYPADVGNTTGRTTRTKSTK